MSDIMKIEVHTFSYNNDLLTNTDGRLRYGFVAQELETVFPGMVKTKNIYNPSKNSSKSNNSNTLLGQYKVVNYIELVPILTKAIQEQQIMIEEQNKSIDELKQQLESLSKRLEELENKN